MRVATIDGPTRSSHYSVLLRIEALAEEALDLAAIADEWERQRLAERLCELANDVVDNHQTEEERP